MFIVCNLEEFRTVKLRRVRIRKKKNDRNYWRFPYGGGPRLYTGTYFMFVELNILIALFYKNYTIVALTKELQLRPRLTLRPTEANRIKPKNK